MASYRPGFLGHPDARTYVIAARRPLYWVPFRPAGYPLLLRALHKADRRLSSAVAGQHALGVATAVLLYRTTGRFASRRAALLPATVTLFSGTQVFLEHSVLSEAPYTFLVAAALECAARSLDSARRLAWLATAGGMLGISATLRSPGVLVVPSLTSWATTRSGLGPRERMAAGASVAGGALVVLAAYLIPQHTATGSWGLTRTTGFTLYARMAPIADCARFTPPPGTSGLCESTPPAQRPTPTWYMFGWPEAPALGLFGAPPSPRQAADHAAYRWPADAQLRRFAFAALRGQPGDYLRSLGLALANYFVPHTGPPSVIEWDHERLIAELRNPHWEQDSIQYITSYYSTGPGYLRRNARALDAYGRRMKIEGRPTAVLASLALLGHLLGRGPARDGASLMAGTAAVMGVGNAALLFYDARYATPLYGPLAAAAALGADQIWTRLLSPRSPRRQRGTRSSR